MKSSALIVVAVSLLAISSADPLGSLATDMLRFIVVPKTLTSTVTSTKIITATFNTSTSCASLSGAPSACRRRRDVLEEPVIYSPTGEPIQPSAPEPLEVSAAPEMRAIVHAFADKNSGASDGDAQQPDLDSSIGNTAGTAEVQIRNLNAICQSLNQQAREASPYFGVGLAQMFGITVVYSTTVTATASSTTTVTSVTKTNTFIIQNCTPSPFPYKTC